MKTILGFFTCIGVCAGLLADPGPFQWQEQSTVAPIYNPISQTGLEDYFPCVIYNGNSFAGHGDAVLYKMWHQGTDSSIALSYSMDGVNWTLQRSPVVTPPDGLSAQHPCVIFDEAGFGSGVYYKMWFWSGLLNSIASIQYSESADGITWTTPVSVSQDLSSPLYDGITPGWWYHLYGPGFVLYNPSATSTPGQPYTFPYVMFFDTSSEGFGPGTSVEQIGLAYSSDGLTWTRYGTDPVLIPSGNPSDWDGTHHFRPSLVKMHDTYFLFYSGSNGDVSTPFPYAHGLGVATSTDGITWTKDSTNPIFINTDGVAWRDTRTYTPFVLAGTFGRTCCGTPCVFKMWFTGGSGTDAGENEGIGYATSPTPFAPPPPPVSACGMITRMGHEHHDKYFVLKAHWEPSPSPYVVCYKVYENKKCIKRVSSQECLSVKKHLHSGCRKQHYFFVSAIDDCGQESSKTPITVHR